MASAVVGLLTTPDVDAGADAAALLLHAVLFRVVTGLSAGRDPATDPAVARTLELSLRLLA